MGTMTGENTGLSVKLLMEHYRRTGNADEARRTWVEAGYCLDAPMLLAAGSHERDVFDDDPDLGWLAMPTMIEREPSNAIAQGPGATLCARSLAMMGCAAKPTE